MEKDMKKGGKTTQFRHVPREPLIYTPSDEESPTSSEQLDAEQDFFSGGTTPERRRPGTFILSGRTSQEATSQDEDHRPTIPPPRRGFKTCYICGKEFGSRSLSAHESQCLEKWHTENNKLPRHLRRPVPQKPEGAGGTDTASEQDSDEAAFQKSLPQLLACENCNRTFLSEQFPGHQKTCQPKDGGSNTTKQSVCFSPHSRKILGTSLFRPQVLPCYICGGEFSSFSLPNHELSCLEKWKIRNKRLPKELRQSPPKKPEPSTSREAEQRGGGVSRVSQLVPCSNCGRTFVPERLSVHRRSCKAPGPIMKNLILRGRLTREDPSESGQSSKEVPSTSSKPPVVKQPKMVFCYICGRAYGTKSISIHEPQCLQKWHAENNALPKKLQKPEPQKPEDRSKDGRS
ncbi:zinc finger protein 474 isoform X2 [Ornithorhynchus anatinus]|uniref:zinc finger protein 474 isoform X2 n=1 Tax=Ornithorhynchus anatinus TaxID=9258 RepID=UPI000454357A|nr:zinc finger protein 474 isoform X2 [Ornithorhynchus anatinus]